MCNATFLNNRSLRGLACRLVLYRRYNPDMKLPTVLLALVALLSSSLALAAGASAEQLAQAFLQTQRGSDGYEYRLQLQKQKVQMPACPQVPQVAWPAGSVPPRSAVELNCPALGWSWRLPLQASQLPVAIVTTRLLRNGEILQAEDVKLAPLARNQSTTGLRDLQQVLGRMVTSTLPAGTVLQGAQLRAPYVVKMNQPVRLQARGEGFVIGSDATALGNAGVGERVNVRTANGKVISATVEADGSVSVAVP